MTNLDFANEATTVIRFPSDRQFAAYRAEVEDRYDARMVRVVRHAVHTDARGTVAHVHHSRGLGAELKGLAYGQFDGATLSTTFHND